MANQKESPAEHLLRAMTITASARFNASRRLRVHQNASLWAVSAFSLVLIIVPLLSRFGVATNFSPPTIELLNIVAAIVILMISILVNSSNFAERAEKMHRCALELNALGREVKLQIEESGSDTTNLRDLQARYEEILARYENHDDLDFRVAQANKFPEFYGIRWWHRARLKLDGARSCSAYLVLILIASAYLVAIIWRRS